MDWTMDCGLWTRFWTGQQTNLVFPGLPTIQYLIASSFVSKVRIYTDSYAFFRHRGQRLRPRQCVGRKLNFI